MGMGVFHFIWYLVVGFLAGLIAKMVMHFHLGLLATILLGVAGSLIGGFIGGLIWKPRDARFHPAGIILSVLGAILVLFVWKRFGLVRAPRGVVLQPPRMPAGRLHHLVG